jgi:hypothetical protein
MSFICLAALVTLVAAHSRLVCPPPRDASIGLKTYPCGTPNDGKQSSFEVHPGSFTVVFEEGVTHYGERASIALGVEGTEATPGAPARLALSLDGADVGFETCVLADHIPHNERSVAVAGLPFTYTQSRVTVIMPDVACERCVLQLTSMVSTANVLKLRHTPRMHRADFFHIIRLPFNERSL